MLQDLAPCCNGIAIPLKGGEYARLPLLGCTLVDHGGQDLTSIAGTSQPIFVNVHLQVFLALALAMAFFTPFSAILTQSYGKSIQQFWLMFA
jgi:hypothetical protein